MIKDNEKLTFRGEFAENDFRIYLEEVKNNTAWVSVPANSLVFRKVDGSDLPATPSESEQDTALFGTMLFVKGNHLPYMGVRECAIPSTRKRLGIDCRAMDSVSTETAASIMTMVAAEMKQDSTVLVGVVDGKVNAMLSNTAGKNSYQVFDAVDVFAESADMVEDLTAAEDTVASKFEAQWGYDGMVCRWETPIKQVLKGNACSTNIEMETSDIGESSVKYGASLNFLGRTIPFMTEQRIEHRQKYDGMNVLEAAEMVRVSVKETAKNIPAAMKEGMDRLNALQGVEIYNPVETMDALSSMVGLPKRAYEAAIRKYVAGHGCGQTNALDLYIALSEINTVYSNKQKNFSNQGIVKSNLLKLLGANWSRYDRYDQKVRDRYR